MLRDDDELIVVDSASTDAAVAVTAAAAGATVLRASRPGLGRARNVGWRAASRPVVAFTDDDCRPEPGWTRHVEAAFADPAVGLVYGQVLPGDGDGEPLSVTTSDQPRLVRPGEDGYGLGHGANLSCRRQALEQVAGFDDELGAGGRFPAAEDVDVAWRLLRAGWSVLFTPEPVVRHDTWRDRRLALRTMYRYGLGSGAAAVKAARLGDGGHALRREVWQEGVRMSWHDLRNGYQFGATACLLRAAGALAGAARARRLTVDEAGNFAP